MHNFPDHPDVARALETGYPHIGDTALHCDVCGAGIHEDEPYYEIAGDIYCPDCVERAKRYA